MKTLNWVKILFIALSLVLAFSLVACVSETPVESDSETEESIDEGNGSVADTDKAPAESGSESAPAESESEETSSETEAAPACTHAECTETAAKAATCTEAGNDAYKICNACEAIIDANGNVISAIPTIAALGHTEVVDAGTPATCTEAGLTEGKHCSVCNEVLVAQETVAAKGHAYNDGEVTTAPTCEDKGVKTFTCANDPAHTYTEDVAATGHSKTDVAYAAPTTAENGWYAHKTCANCDALWNADDEEIDAIPTIEKIVPTTDVYLGFEELKDKLINGVPGSKFGVSPAADRTYVSFKRTGDSDDGNIMFLADNTEVTGKYFVLKYRTDHMTSVQIWANTTENGHSGGKANFYQAVNGDGNWHIAIVDLSAKLSTYVKPDDNGNYTVQWSRIDMLDGPGSSGYFDIAFVAFCDDLADVAGILADGDEAYCDHVAPSNPTYTNRGENHSTECVICGSDMFYQHSISTPVWDYTAKKYVGSCACGATIESAVLYVSEGYISGNIGCNGATPSRNDAEGVTRYTVTGTGDVFFHVYAEGTAVTGEYAVIKYRAYDEDNNASFGNWFTGSVMDTAHGMATNTSDQGSGGLGNVISDGEWHYIIVKANSAHFIPNEDGTYSYKFLRFGLGNVAPGSYIEVDEIAFADSRYVVNLYVNGEAVCTHEKVSEVYNPETEILTTTCLYCGHVTESACEHAVVVGVSWNDTKKVYEGTCTECNKTVDKTMLYTTESDVDGAVGSKANYIMSYQENGFVRYKAEKDPSGDSYFFPLRNNKNVTGQYMVIKYRANNKGKNLAVGTIYASSVASGGAPGATGSSSNAVLTSSTIYADGEWHYLVISPNLNANASFTTNADGTYSWAYIRMVVSGWAAFDGSCYFDVDEIAFADNETAVWNYTGGAHTARFNAHTQAFKVNGTDTSITTDVENKPISADINAEVESLHFDAWVCTPGGVEAYYVRATKIDGEVVASPALVKWHDGNDRTDIYTAVGANKGYTSTCAIGAGFSGDIDLSAYAGKKIDIEIVAMTNGGAEAVIAVFTNITVK